MHRNRHKLLTPRVWMDRTRFAFDPAGPWPARRDSERQVLGKGSGQAAAAAADDGDRAAQPPMSSIFLLYPSIHRRRFGTRRTRASRQEDPCAFVLRAFRTRASILADPCPRSARLVLAPETPVPRAEFTRALAKGRSTAPRPRRAVGVSGDRVAGWGAASSRPGNTRPPRSRP